MLQCIFLLSDSGEVMLEKQLTGHRVDRSICAWFWEQAISQGDSFKLVPVIASPTHYLFQIVREGITFLTCTQVEMPPLMGIEMIGLRDHLTLMEPSSLKTLDTIEFRKIRVSKKQIGTDRRVGDLYVVESLHLPQSTFPVALSSFYILRPLSIVTTAVLFILSHNTIFHERTKHIEINCHFVRQHLQSASISLPFISSALQLVDFFTKTHTTAQLLEEMIDNGFPLTTEPNILREMIPPPNIVSKMLSVVTGNSSNVSNTLPGATATCVPWRTMDLKHSNNEVYVDLVEEMDAIINRDGALVKCEVYGEVQVNSHLSGLPDLTLSFANPSILNDVRFHPCVRFRPWESHQILSFVPPDGQFKLMSYRVKKLKSTPIYVKPQLTSDSGTCRVSVLVGIRNDPGKTIDSITVQFQLPPCILSADLTSNHGTVNILADKTCSWSVGRIPKDKAPSMSGTLVLETGLERLHVFPTFKVGFRIMGVALSGLQIDKLDLKNLPNRPYKGFRALTRAGEFEVRS
ncbi:hypothetical protein HYC85_010127 [Camellia sinensis]|uniref:MHD domain-containing protein n=1 Tax=Camellia sinensis TaxID=4442 RepID=A0A7J7HH76_CAMSI|nr:hypothetical protein HYC85_010127 [Camellia sinensis]